MGKTCLLLTVVVSVGLTAVAVAQTQNQSAPNQTQTQNQTTQNSTPNQAQPAQAQPSQAQPQPKVSFWQKMKQSAAQGMQNAAQQGNQQAQQGMQGVTNGVQQGTQAAQQGAQQAVAGGAPGTAAFGSSNSSGSCGAACFNAGPFLASVSQMTMSQEGPWHVIRMNIQFHNTTNQPLIIAYHDGSMVMTDNNGSTYQGSGGNPGELQGMGIDRGAQTDPQFVLSPGQTSSAMFSVARGRPANSPIGTGYSYNLTIDELQTQNGATAIAVRSYNLNFASLTPGSASSLTSFSSGLPAGASATTGATVTSAVTNGTATAPRTAVATTTPSTVLTNAAIKTPVTAAAKPSPAVKPIPTTATINSNKAGTTNAATTSSH